MNKRIVSKLVLLAIAGMLGAVSAAAQTGPYQFFAVASCRVVDTRNPTSTNGGPILSTGTQRNFAIRGNCGVPATAKAVSLNVTITGATSTSFLTQNDAALANGAIVGLAATSTDLSVFNSQGNVHAILDVTGYFQ